MTAVSYQMQWYIIMFNVILSLACFISRRNGFPRTTGINWIHWIYWFSRIGWPGWFSRATRTLWIHRTTGTTGTARYKCTC